MDDFWKAMGYRKKHVDIALKVCDRNVEGGAYENLNNDSTDRVTFKKPLNIKESLD